MRTTCRTVGRGDRGGDPCRPSARAQRGESGGSVIANVRWLMVVDLATGECSPSSGMLVLINFEVTKYTRYRKNVLKSQRSRKRLWSLGVYPSITVDPK